MTAAHRGAFAAVLVLVLAAGCGAAEPGRAAPSASPAPSSAMPAGAFNGTDVVWAQLMIVMDERALTLLDLAPRRTKNIDLQQLAARAAGRHRAELGELRALLHRAEVSERNPHEGHDMPGMATADQLSAVAASTDAAFDRLFAARLLEHLEQAVRLAKSEQTAGNAPPAKALASTVEAAGSGELATLGSLRI